MDRVAVVTEDEPAMRFLPAKPFTAALLFTLLVAASAHAVFNKPISLKDDALREEFIFTATVEAFDPDKLSMTFKMDAKLKGKPPFEKLVINLAGVTEEGKKENHVQVMLDRLEPGRKMIAFSNKRGKKFNAIAFMEGTWFSIQGTTDDDNTVRWKFLNCEPNLRGTFKGTTAELIKVIEDALAGKAEPPPPNFKEPPGFGPPIKKKCDAPPALPSADSGSRLNGGPLFGVMPSLALIGPMAILAALFPGVAARMAVGMKKWRAFLVIASTNSTMALIYFFLGNGYFRVLPDTPAFSLTSFTLYLMGFTVIGLVWAGRRYRRMAIEDASVTDTPSKAELYTLAGLTLFASVLAGSTRFFGPWSAALELPMREFTFIAAALLVATLYACYRAITRAADGPAPPVRLSLSGETVGLSCLFLCGFTTVLLSQGGQEAARPVINVADNGNIKFLKHDVFEIKGADQVMSGFAVGGDRLYFGASSLKFSSQEGVLFCIDRNTGQVHWKFEADDDLQPVFSTPTLADGKVYFGEGLHEHKNCRFFCLDAITGKPAWGDPFKTASHTEGTPLVINGSVFFTGGDDGLFCADTRTGAKKWQAGGKAKGLHIDGPPAASGKRIFAGSGLYTNAVFALDAETGNELWRTPVPLRSFGPPLVIDDRVVYGLGTGNMLSDTFKYREEGDKPEEKEPAGAVICVEAATGKIVWQFDLPKSVHTSLAADGLYVYAASRDGCVYCLNRKNGKLRWKMPLGITLTAGPAVAADEDGFPIAVYAATTEGTVACLNPHTGKPFWLRDLNELTGKIVDEVYATPVIVTEGKKRTIYVGALVKNRNNSAKTAAVFRFEDELE